MVPSSSLPQAKPSDAVTSWSSRVRTLSFTSGLLKVVLFVAVAACLFLGPIEWSSFLPQTTSGAQGNDARISLPGGKVPAGQAAAAIVPQTTSLSEKLATPSPSSSVSGDPFYTRYTSKEWFDYYSPLGKNKVFFQPGRPTNPYRALIGAGLGRTGTVSVAGIFEANGTHSAHFSGVVSALAKAGRKDAPDFHEIVPLDYVTAANAHANQREVGFADNPTGFYVWDIMSAFSDWEVVLSVREVDTFYTSLLTLYASGGGRGGNKVATATYGCIVRPSTRQATRRFFEHNAKVITTVPETKLTVIDFTKPGSKQAIARITRTPVDSTPTVYSHSTKSATKALVNITRFLDPTISKPTRSTNIRELTEANPSNLDIIRYMTPLIAPATGIRNSVHWFDPDRMTSDKPLIICAGFEGTGLMSLLKVFETLGVNNVTYPTVPDEVMVGKWKTKMSRTLQDLINAGLQEENSRPEIFEHMGAVIGRPVPTLTWDFLEAFPNAKVILTVREVSKFVKTILQYNDGPFPEAGKAQMWMKAFVYGAPGNELVDERQAVRKYLEHNNKIIHGVPKQQLLVWDMEKEPSWEKVCEFLGVPTPAAGTPFPIVDPRKY